MASRGRSSYISFSLLKNCIFKVHDFHKAGPYAKKGAWVFPCGYNSAYQEEGRIGLRDRLVAFLESPRPPGKALRVFAEDALGIETVEDLALAMTEEENGGILKELWLFPDEDLRLSLLPFWKGRGWDAPALAWLCTSLQENTPSAILDLGQGKTLVLPLDGKMLVSFVKRLSLERHVDSDLWKQMDAVLPENLLAFCRNRLWTLGVDTVKPGAGVLERLLAFSSDPPFFRASFILMTEILAEVSGVEVWPQPLLRARRRMERTVLSARRIQAALERGNMETFLLSGGRVVHGDAEEAARKLFLADTLMHRLWPGILPLEAPLEARAFGAPEESGF
jgi:hypothetical protein